MSDPTVRGLVWRRADDRCEYCRLPQHAMEATFHVEHILACSIRRLMPTPRKTWLWPTSTAICTRVQILAALILPAGLSLLGITRVVMIGRSISRCRGHKSSDGRRPAEPRFGCFSSIRPRRLELREGLIAECEF